MYHTHDSSNASNIKTDDSYYSSLSYIGELLCGMGANALNHLCCPQKNLNEELADLYQTQELQRLLDLLSEKCYLQTKVNEHINAHNALLERQLDLGFFELDSVTALKMTHELQELKAQLSQLEGASFNLNNLSELSVSQNQILENIDYRTGQLNNLIEINNHLTLVSVDILKRQEQQISEKKTQHEELEEQLKRMPYSGTFFADHDSSKKNAYGSISNSTIFQENNLIK